MVTDSIADFLVRLQNASAVGKERVRMPFSKMKESLAALLARSGYSGEIKHPAPGILEVELRYGMNGRPAISGSRRISKPSRRLYRGAGAIRPVKHGHGLLVLSTPKGILTGGEARKGGVGGEVLFEIW